jgi:hypothetical protein
LQQLSSPHFVAGYSRCTDFIDRFLKRRVYYSTILGNRLKIIEIRRSKLMDKSKWKLANDTHASPDDLAALANDHDWMIRIAVARNNNTPPEALKKLAQDMETSVRKHVAGNPFTPVDTLDELANDRDFMVRGDASRNPSMRLATVEKLAEDPNYTVRKNAIETGRI